MGPVRRLIGASACVAGRSPAVRHRRPREGCDDRGLYAEPDRCHPTASRRIVNHSSKSSLYTIHVKFTDSAGNGVGDGVAAVASVDPGTMAKWTAGGTVNAKGPVKCKLSSVT